MNTDRITAAASQMIDGFDTTAHQLIGLWRTGTDRLGTAARDRWDSAFEQSKPQLSKETQRNAANARDVFARYYAQGTTLAASGAEVAVQAVVQAARTAVGQAAGWQQRRA